MSKKKPNLPFQKAPTTEEQEAVREKIASINDRLLKFTAQLVLDENVVLTAVYEDVAAEGIRTYPATIKFYKSSPEDVQTAKSILEPPKTDANAEADGRVEAEESSYLADSHTPASTESIVDVLTK